MDVIVLDGANGFDPYRVSSFARKALIPPERLLKRIRIARAFTCYQMATLVDETGILVSRRGVQPNPSLSLSTTSSKAMRHPSRAGYHLSGRGCA